MTTISNEPRIGATIHASEQNPNKKKGEFIGTVTSIDNTICNYTNAQNKSDCFIWKFTPNFYDATTRNKYVYFQY